MRLAFAPSASFAVGLCSIAMVLWPNDAQAFCRTTTCDPSVDCEYDIRGCTTVGLPLEWKRSCVSYSVHRDGSPKRSIDYSTVHQLTARAFERWTKTDCDGESPSLEVSDMSPVLCGEPEYNSNHPNANIIMFRDTDWPYAGANATLALTTITFNFETGEIFDADIEVNSFRTPLTTSDVGVEFDLESILTHETGHFLGLSHSHVHDATMYLEYSEGDSSLRNLHADDMEGICASYPPNRTTSGTSCKPRHGFSPDCKPPPESGCNVAFAAAGQKPLGPISGVALLVLLGWRARRRG
jgi:hypothetical protein